MDNRNGNRNGDYHKNTLLKRFLVQLLVFMMIFGMMPGQSLAYYAATDDAGALADEQTVPEEDQGGTEAQPTTQEEKGDKGESAAVPESQDKQEEPAAPTTDQKKEDQQKTEEAKPQAGTGKKDADNASTVNEDAQQKDTSTETKRAAKKAGAKAGTVSPEEQAEINYGENGEARTFTVSLKDNKDTAYAGEEIGYNVNVSMWAAATYPYDGQNQEAMFEEWRNISIVLTLPENVEALRAVQDNVQSIEQTDKSKNEWTIRLKRTTRDAKNSNSINFDIIASITGNGKLGDGTVLGPASVAVKAYFDVRIDEDGTTKEYSHEVTDHTDDIKLKTLDEWMVTKEPHPVTGSKPYDINADGTVTVHYLLKYGLKVGATPAENKTAYTGLGRVPFADDFTLKDTPTLTLYNGETREASSITVTPAETGYKYYDTEKKADDENGAIPIHVEKGEPVELPHAVVGSNDKKVDPDAPFFSKYIVDMVYDYDEFLAKYSDNPENVISKSINNAVIDYQLKGRTEKETTEAEAKTDIPGYIEPGHVVIEKHIEDYIDSTKRPLYDHVSKYISGPATYRVFKEDGTTDAEIYYKDEEGKYQKIKEGTPLTIDPSAPEEDSFGQKTNGTDGTIDFYLDAGTYVIKETGMPHNTHAVDGVAQLKVKATAGNLDKPVEAKFYNKENLGQIRIHKVDDSPNKHDVEKAGFELYEDEELSTPVLDENDKPMYAETDHSGLATFDRLPEGTYWLYESKVPDGFIRMSGPVKVQVNINDTAEIEIANHNNRANITLLKQYSTVNNPHEWKAVTADFNTFAGAFELQRSIDGKNWEKADNQKHSIDENGKCVLSVDLVDANNEKYMYRFKETIPNGYYHETDEKERTQISEAIIPADGNYDITMKNRTAGFIELTKYKATVNGVGTYKQDFEPGKEFDLYRVSEGKAELVDTKTTISGGKIRFEKLVSIDENEKDYTFYVVENNPDKGFTWTPDAYITPEGQSTPIAAIKVGKLSGASSNTLKPVVYNIEQKVKINVIKKDALTEKKLDGAEFTINDGTHTTSMDNLPYEIELGKVYTIKETKAPDNYYLPDNASELERKIDTTDWKVVRQNGKYVVVDDKGAAVDELLTVTFSDLPYQNLRVTKKVRDIYSSETTSLAGVTFSVYIKEGNTFKPYNNIKIEADGNHPVALPEGNYYLHEDTEKNGTLFPDKHWELYKSLNPNMCEYDDENGKFYFGPYEVKKPQNSKETTWDVDVVNIFNTGELIVKKKLYDETGKPVGEKDTALNGFRMYVYKADVDGNPVGDPVQQGPAITGQGTPTVIGQARFTKLPVFDKDGKPIRYVVVEKYVNGQDTVFYTNNYQSSESPIMEFGQTADAGFVENHKYISVSVVKKYYDAREFELTDLKYDLEGATIALYQKTDDGDYKLKGKAVTDSKGRVLFGGLEYSDKGYVAIEYDIPDKDEYKYMAPAQQGAVYLKDYVGGRDCPDTLEQDDVDKLSKVVLLPGSDGSFKEGEIDNVIPWTQIHITKLEKGTEMELDGANFTLYKQVLPEGTRDGSRTFDESKCTVVGEYTSGTWIKNGAAQTGEFQTDVLENADNIIYWLVETKAPTGHTIIDEYKYILFTREGTEYVNASNGGNSHVVNLKDNTINKFVVYNDKETGPDGTENWAYIKFTKWMQRESTSDTKREDLERSDFVLMPNAVFELYVVNKETGKRVLLLDTITTGNENEVDGHRENTTGYGVSRSMDAWKIFDSLEAMYPDREELKKYITYRSSKGDLDYPYVTGDDGKRVTDSDGNYSRIPGTFWVNATLVEKSASSKYELDVHDHNMEIEFVPDDLYLGNDKYAVPKLDEPGIYEEYSSEFCNKGNRRKDFDNAHKSMAIVDYLSTEKSVTLRHFGYDPLITGYELTHDKLEAKHDANPSQFESKKVTFSLQKKGTDGKWNYWSPSANQSTNSSGSRFDADGNGYLFTNGLDPGDYRVIMVTPAKGYENFYNTDTAFCFTVTVSDRTQTFTTYSPERPDLTIKKTDKTGKTITKAAKFSLVSADEGKTYKKIEKSTVDGEVVFEDLPALSADSNAPGDVKYVLEETTAPSGYTTEYFTKFFSLKYPKFAALVDAKTGYNVSYRTKVENGERLIVKDDYNTIFNLEVPNVESVSVKIIKKDSQADPVKHLNGAEFMLYYHPFETVKDRVSIPTFSKDTWKKDGWREAGTMTTATASDGSVGIATKDGLAPGTYYAVETKAPNGYDISIEGKNGKTIVMTGGLDVTVPSSDKYVIWTSTEEPGELEFSDIPKVKLFVYKDVSVGLLPKRSYEFNFTVEDSTDPSIGSSKTAKGTLKDDGTISQTPAEFTGMSQGRIYYLTEKSKEGYQIATVKIGTTEITADEKGRYPIEIPTDGSNVSVTVTNTLLEARVTFLKYDGQTGVRLKGAGFEVLDSKGQSVKKAEVTDNGDGSYTAVIPLTKADGEDFVIHEVKAPEVKGKKYTIDDNNDEIAVNQLTAGEHRRFEFHGVASDQNKYALPNFQGTTVKLYKYNGLPGNKGNDVLKGATFQMYFSTDGGNSWDTWHPAETTKEDGIAEFMILNQKTQEGVSYKFAVAETNEIQGYSGLHAVTDEAGKELSITASSDKKKLYILEDNMVSGGKDIRLNAYNTPYLGLVVKKQDVSGTVKHPNAHFFVYEVPNGTKEDLTEQEIENLSRTDVDYIEGTTRTDKTTGESTYKKDNYIQPGKTYLAVEDLAIDSDTNPNDYSIIKDDSNVVYYQVFSIPAANYAKEYTVIFKNNKGSATVDIAKDVDKSEVDTLTLDSRKLKYTLTPTSTNEYALDAYRLSDSGLTAEGEQSKKPTLAAEWYNIEKVTLGQCSMEPHLKNATGTNYPIEATVTFVDFDGNKYEQDPVDVSTGNIEVEVSSAGIGKNIQSFYVDYSSPALKAATADKETHFEGYALGQNFNAKPTTVDVTVFKQEKQSQDTLNAITKIINNAAVELKYTPWSPTGEKKEQIILNDEDPAETIVKPARAPKIDFEKSSKTPEDQSVELGSTITYELKVTNISDEPIDFTDPIIVDLLPQGMVVDQQSNFVTVPDEYKLDTIQGDPVVKTGYAGDSQYVNIAFNGTVPAGKSLIVNLEAVVTGAVTNYGPTMMNFAFTTSQDVGVATVDNETGAVIKDKKGLWASELVALATQSLKCDMDRAVALKKALGDKPDEQGTYGYVGDWAQNNWTTENTLVCVKEEYGPSDGETYRTDKVAVLENEEAESNRTMHYKLTINNLSPSKRTNLAIMDIMPNVGDNRINNTARGSNWQLYFKDLGSVMVNGKECKDNSYKIYYYEDDITSFKGDSITEVVNASKRGCPAGWTTDKPERPTAFIIAFNYNEDSSATSSTDDTVILEGNNKVEIEYTAVTDYRNAESLAEIVFTNAANDFNFGFSTIPIGQTAGKAIEENPLDSNVVEVTIAPPNVVVGGDVWIDSDSNGIQDDGAQSWYLKYDIVKQLIKDLKITLNISNQRNLAVTDSRDGTIAETGINTNDDDKYGIAHFEFDKLTSAKIRSGSSATNKNWLDEKGQAGNLIGKNPYTYNMNMNYKGSTFTKTKNVVDQRGSYVPGSKSFPDDDRTDDNFETRRGEYQTEQFFLHQTADVFDMTKDNGYNLLRTLNLTKTSLSGGDAIEGAEFSIYGPFDHYTGKDQDLTGKKPVAVLTTDKDGKASYGQLYSFIDPEQDQELLFFFKEYVIVETKAAEGYAIEGAEADGANITKLDEGKWLLRVPDKKSVDQVEDVTVRDPGNIEVEVEKKWDDDEDAYGTRPESINVMLYTDEDCTEEAKYADGTADGTTVESRTLDEGNSWRTKWEQLPRYKVVKTLIGEERKPIQYYVKETDSKTGKDLNGYEVTIVPSTDEDTGNQSLEITNKPISTGLEVRKTWKDTDDLAAAVTAVTFRVEQSADGETWTPAKARGEEIHLTIERKQGEKMGTAEIEGLPAYDADNNPLTYRAVEISITANGKVIEVKDGKVGSYEVTEKHTPGRDASPEKATATDLSEISNIMIPTEFTVEKSFVDDDFNLNKDIRSINVMLQRKSGSGDWTNAPEGAVDLRSIRGWKHTWKDLPKYDMAGNAYDYRAIEVSYTTKSGETVEVLYDNTAQTSGSVGGYRYTSSTEGDTDSGYTTYIENKPVKGSLKVNKQWKDAGRATVPESITVKLSAFADGKEIRLSGVTRSVTLSKANNWSDSTTWDNLPVYTADGVQISYQLTESGKGKYTAEYKINYGDGVVGEGSGTTLDVKLISDRVVDATFINKLEPPVKTGDNAPLLGYLALLLASALCIVLICIRRRQNN